MQVHLLFRAVPFGSSSGSNRLYPPQILSRRHGPWAVSVGPGLITFARIPRLANSAVQAGEQRERLLHRKIGPACVQVEVPVKLLWRRFCDLMVTERYARIRFRTEFRVTMSAQAPSEITLYKISRGTPLGKTSALTHKTHSACWLEWRKSQANFTAYVKPVQPAWLIPVTLAPVRPN